MPTDKTNCKKDAKVTFWCIVAVFVVVALFFNFIQWVSKMFK